MSLEIILTLTAIIALLIASYSDLKIREVPDWVSYGLIFAVLGIRLIYSLSNWDWTIIFSGILGFTTFFILAFGLYKAHQWGGGDSKLLMGMGAVIGITFPFDLSSWNLLLFFLSLLFLGAIYGIFWMVYIAIIKWKEFVISFTKHLKQHRITQISVWTVSLLLLIFVFNIFPKIWQLSLFIVAAFYLFLFVLSVESGCLFNKVHIQKLTPGDWLAEDLKKDEKIVRMKTLVKKDIWSLRSLHAKGKVHYVTIREGIPFIPSFLFAYLALIFGKNIWFWLIGLF